MGQQQPPKDKKLLSDLVFRYIERFGYQIVTFIVSTILARLVVPEMYGVVAIANIFITISNVFTVSGIANSLIQKKEADQTDYDTAFVLNLLVTVLMYVLLFFFAPFIAKIYKQELLTDVLRVLTLVLPVSSIRTVQQAWMERNKRFKEMIMPTAVSGVVSGALGIVMALQGWGIWSLIAQTISGSVISTLLMIPLCSWRPRFTFSVDSAKQMFSYGWKLLVADLLDTAYGQSKPIIVGLIYSAADVAYFNKGQSFPQIVVSNISAALNSVLFSYMSSVQDNLENLKQMTRNSVRMCTFVIFPMMLGMALVAENVIVLLLTETWLPSVPYMQILCFCFAFNPIAGACIQAIKAIGRSDAFLKIELVKKSFGIILLLLVFHIDVIWIAYSLAITTVFSAFVNMFPQKKYLNYGFGEQLFDILKNVWLLIPMGVSVYFVGQAISDPLVGLTVQVITGVVVYVLTAWVSRNSEFESIKRLLFKKR